MSMQDITSDVITRIRNAQSANKETVDVLYSKLILNLLSVLHAEGYIASFDVFEERPNCRLIRIKLKYYQGSPVIDSIQRVSKPSIKVYVKTKNIPSVLNGLGTVILSTPKGVMTDRDARRLGVGGEVLVFVE